MDFIDPQSMRLVEAVQELSMARDLDSVMQIVRKAARELTGADGATFVLRDGRYCFYAEEDAITPLWKGCRFPMEICISGWAMLHKQSVVIPDIYQDERIPHAAYRPTFVKSLAMVPIRTRDPIGAIGNYWASERSPSEREVRLLSALADSTSIAMENVNLYRELEQRVADRTQELEAFSYSVSHDLRAPLRSIAGFTRSVLEMELPADARADLQRVEKSALRMNQLIEDLIGLARTGRGELRRTTFDLGVLARRMLVDMQRAEPDHQVEIVIADGLTVHADEGLAQVLLDNLLRNARKFTRKTSSPRVEVGCTGEGELFVRDNGAGFDAAYAEKLFKPFQRLHSESDFPGTGIGLATVQRIVKRHGGKVRAEGAVNQGATFYWTFSAT